MTYDEAIEILQRRKLLLLDKLDDFQKISEATDLAIQSLKDCKFSKNILAEVLKKEESK